MRVFIAYPISDEVKNEIIRVQDELKGLNAGKRITWVNPEAMHVTVQFLGDVEDEQIENIKQVLRTAPSASRRFTYRLDGLDAFPNIREPRVLIIRATDESGTGEKLQQDVAEGLRRVGIEDDGKTWTAHVTIGRNKEGGFVKGMADIKASAIEWDVDWVELIASELTPDGPRYTVLQTFRLVDHG
ncbi:MAG: 2'-5' RNA ligase [Candidatus Magasanikbacteria bacterium RIFCSPHIGHO2_02_FULL_51_14]|uniref:RNA 2',3'-cyclic phosphodiesterase n=1 Tax=Candidatus Magasanikbacteria bacterium RIFCSPHIGHO2_02_FULL_51_14 TaxID=1798683 RepID=A0A1F6MDD0_9BACT|nr:MAG: 2'-5' RNA ligase [Candidatus Magasanikbacteria bacterium RIFCSPHIGHO2_02_FULL_51_14]